MVINAQEKVDDGSVREAEKIYFASQWQLLWLKFRKHKLAIASGILLGVFYLLAVFCDFFAPYHMHTRTEFTYSPPQRIHFFDDQGTFHFRPFVYKQELTIDFKTMRRVYKEDKNRKFPIYFFVQGDEYKFWNLFQSDIHFFGVKEAEGTVFLLGSDKLGRDVFSRVLYGSRISLSIGLVGVFLSLFLGSILGGISGYFGGTPDMIIQRVIEFLTSIPRIPLWMALAVALPTDWSMIRIYFGITIVLSIVGWTGIARVVRGQLLELREEDFVLAARLSGASHMRIIFRHLLPSVMTYLIVHLTIAIPEMIIAETSLSFLGLGIQPPAVSWGALLKDAQSTGAIGLYPWILIPGLFVIITALCFNFLGDGLRDAADPYK